MDADFDFIYYRNQFILYLFCWLGLGIGSLWIPVTGETKQKVRDLQNRIVSLVHGVLILWMSSWGMYYGGYNEPNHDVHIRIAIFSAAYFTQDLIMMTALGLNSIQITFHHFTCIGGFLYMVWAGYGGCVEITGIFYAEFSNFPMHMRTMLKDYGLRYTNIHDTFEWLYFFTYFFGRLYGGSLMIWDMWLEAPMCPILVRLAGTILIGQSVFFVGKMLSIMKKRYGEIK